MANKLLIVYNTCGISGREQVSSYVESLNTILNQDIDDSKVVVSSCLNSVVTRKRLQKEFGNKVAYNFISDVLPVNVTFNQTCLQAIEEYGEFEGYLYIDSGISIPNTDSIRKLYELFKSKNYAMTAAQTDTDAGYLQWFGIGKHHHDTSENFKLFQNGDFEIPIGKTINLHCQIFSNELYKAFGGLIPDIFASYCTESVFTSVCAAVNSRFVLSKDVMVNHVHGMDLGSSGFDPIKWASGGRPTWDHPFKVPSVISQILPGQAKGAFYETCQNIIPVDPSAYNPDGTAKYPAELKAFIRNNMFLINTQYFDYTEINHQWIK